MLPGVSPCLQRYEWAKTPVSTSNLLGCALRASARCRRSGARSSWRVDKEERKERGLGSSHPNCDVLQARREAKILASPELQHPNIICASLVFEDFAGLFIVQARGQPMRQSVPMWTIGR